MSLNEYNTLPSKTFCVVGLDNELRKKWNIHYIEWKNNHRRCYQPSTPSTCWILNCIQMSSRGDDQTKVRTARSSSLDGSVCTVSSIPSIPSIQVSQSVEWTDEWEDSEAVPSEVEVDPGEGANRVADDGKHQTKSVSVDHERQVLLLFLLAQVCALHDPTPRTFTYVKIIFVIYSLRKAELCWQYWCINFVSLLNSNTF